MRRFRTILVALLLLLSSCYDSHTTPPTNKQELTSNCTIAQLRQFCREGYYNIESNIVCVGHVTSSDKDGNFYRTMFVEDTTGAIEVKLGTYNISSQYPTGLEVALHLKGCTIVIDKNVLQVGLSPQSYDSTIREMGSQEIIDKHIVRGTSVSEIEPLACNVSTLDTSLCGRFVKISDLRYSPLEGEYKAGYYRFTDESDSALFVYISPYANFTDVEMHSYALSIQGILYHESVGMNIGHQFVIKPRSKDDFSTAYHSF